MSCQRTERQRLASGTSPLLKYSSTTITTAVLKMLRFTADADPKNTSCSSDESAGNKDRRERWGEVLEETAQGCEGQIKGTVVSGREEEGGGKRREGGAGWRRPQKASAP